MYTVQLLMSGVLVVSLAAGDKPAKKEQEKLQGAWTVERLEFSGKDLTDKYKLHVVIKGNRLSVEGDKEIQQDYAQFAFKIDPRTAPKCIDLTVSVGGQKGATLEGIYEVKGKELKICLQVFGTERPGEFKSPAGKSMALVLLKKK